jgi:hypothetical protein
MKQPTAPTIGIEVTEIDDRRALTEPDEDEEGPPLLCPRCGYQQPAEFAARPRTWGPQPVDICVNCAEFMTYDPRFDAAEEMYTGVRTPTPVLITAADMGRVSPKTCRQLLEEHSLTQRLAQMRGYHLHRLKLRGGRA